MDAVKRPINYIVAQIGTSTDGQWTITYYGDVPEQGGLSLRKGEITFVTLEDALTFLARELPKHDYVQMIKDAKI